MPALPKTNACRLLDTLGIAYELLAYEVDEAALDAVTVAQKLGLRRFDREQLEPPAASILYG